MYTQRQKYKHMWDKLKHHRQTVTAQESVLQSLPHRHTTDRLTDSPDDSFLQLPLLVSFDYLCADVDAAVIGAGQLVVHTEAELPQQGVKHFQHCGAW